MSDYHKDLVQSHQALQDLGVPRPNQTELLEDIETEMREEGIPIPVNSGVNGYNGPTIPKSG